MEKKPFSAQKRGRIYVALSWAGVLIALLGSLFSELGIWAGIAVVILSVVYRFTMVRCPHCGSKLLGCRSVPKCCPDCGKELD